MQNVDIVLFNLYLQFHIHFYPYVFLFQDCPCSVTCTCKTKQKWQFPRPSSSACLHVLNFIVVLVQVLGEYVFLPSYCYTQYNKTIILLDT